MHTNKRALFLGFTSILLATQTTFAGDKAIKNEKFLLKLTAPISTATSKAGDQFTAIVVEPAEYRDAIVEGRVRKVEPAQNLESPKSHIDFGFETLTVGDKTFKVQAVLQEVTNSQGVAKVDEEGQAIAQGNGGKRAMAGLGGAGVGALAGGMLGGGVGSLIGGAAGGSLGYVIAVDVTASSKNIEFYPGSLFTVEVSSKGIDKDVDSANVHAQEAASEATMAKAAPVAPAPTAPPSTAEAGTNAAPAGAPKPQ
jgi:hypothetical protein